MVSERELSLRESCGLSAALVVQSCPDRSTAIAEIVEFLGYDCIVADSPAEFLGLYLERDFDLLVFDLFMERMDGIEIVQWLVGRENRTNALLTVSTRNLMKVQPDSPLLHAARLLAEAGGTFRVEQVSDLDLRNGIEARIEKLIGA